MHLNQKISLKNKRVNWLFLIISMFFLILLINFNLISSSKLTIYDLKNPNKDQNKTFQNVKISNPESILFQGTEYPLNITDYGNLNEFNREIVISNQEELNLSYYIDETNNWKVNKVETSINNIQDTRNWVNNSGFKPIQIFRVNQTFESAHDYSNNNNPYSDIDHTITETGAYYLRVHFVNMSFDYQIDASDSDFMAVLNGSLNEVFAASGYREDFYSPWSIGETILLSYSSDNSPPTRDYGYYIDYYEFINASSNLELNSINWEGNYVQSGSWGSNTYGSGNIENTDAMFIGYHGSWYNDLETYLFSENTFTELYQDNIIVPRGKVIDSYLSFDYYTQFALETNNIIMYLKIGGEKVYSKGLLDLNSEGKNLWHHTDKVPMYLWINQTNIFSSGDIKDQTLNITFGIRNAGFSTIYGGYEDGNANLIWFDNITLGITTIANATQEGINLTINQLGFEDQNEWGKAKLNLTEGWDTDPIILTINTTSPELTFDLNTTLYGYHETFSSYNQLYDQGVSYKILENGTVYWKLYHYLYMPPPYEDFEFKIEKPINWDFLTVLDPFLQTRYFESGKFSDNYIRINKSNALFAGWYTLTATSANYLNSSNTKIFKQSQWVQNANFSSGESTQITTQLNYMGEIPNDVGDINLTIYYPNGTIFYEESQSPLNGNVTFSQITFGAFNTSGGLYEYTLFWSNGTAVGGLKSSFIMNHQSSIELLKPNDAKLDLRTEGFVGDIIPVRIFLKDVENNFTISNAIVSYNWSDGTRTFSDAGLGIYETTLFTEDLASRGLYNIIINSSKIGFITSNITLEINLGEETNIQVLESEYNIELHANSTIRFKFSDFDGDGIDGATVNISIINETLYSIENPGNGTYNLEFSTLFIDAVGIYQISINFSAVSYEPQNYIYQFQIIKQSVNLSVYVNSIQIIENSLKTTTFNNLLNISVKAISNIDNEYLSGVITCISSFYQKNLTEYGNFWFNTSIFSSPDNFSYGINYIYLQFEDPNYRTATFGFQLFIDQIEIKVNPISFEDSINAEIGETINIQIQLVDNITDNYIENASITCTWDYGYSTLNETTPGSYQVNIKLPDNLHGNYKFDLIISPKGSIYKTKLYSFIVIIAKPVIGATQLPSVLLWIIIGVLVSIVSALGALSLRSYVILPRKRKKEAELLTKTQKFKDLRNIQAIVMIHRLSGIPLYTKTYSILEKHKKELFSGFIQAITTIGEEFTESEEKESKLDTKKESYGNEKIIELDFKYFFCVIADKEDIRIVFILKEKSSERLRSQILLLLSALNLKLSQELENWDGSLDIFEEMVPAIIGEYFELYYKGSFTLPKKINLFMLRKDKSFSKMEIRVLNVVQSMSKRIDEIITLNSIIELVSEENKDLIIEAIEVLIERKLIIPTNP